jgi:DNA repair exonuclease SbcCD ATPase subunit
MIIFEKIRYKNFLSSGNSFTEINLTQSNTSLIIGSNGAGKSTILDALTFSLFSKSFRGINKPQLINSTNEKDCIVEIDFKIGTVEWKVRRGLKPNIFEIYRDGTLLDQNSSSTDQQKWFEQNVLKMNYRSFTQIVILGSSNFVPFMQLTAASRREVIEDLLDIKIFSVMNSVVKERIKLFKDEIRTLELKQESLSDKVKMQQDFIDDIEKRGKEDIDMKKISVLSLTEDIGHYMDDNQKLQEKIEELQEELDKYTGATEKLRKLGNLKGKISQKVSTITEEHKFFDKNTVCPTCTQNIEDEFRLNKLCEAELKAKELQKGYEELEQTIKDEEIRENKFSEVSKELTNLNHDISKNNTRISSINRQISDLQNEIQKTSENLANRNTEHEKLEKFKQDLNKILEDLGTTKETISNHDFIYGLLKDSGVKSKIIKRYLPLINQQVNRYLQLMDFYINFKLDEEFKESVESPIHEDFSYSSFSEGEKQRIDLALLFTWREIAKIKNSTNTNLLIMDEIFDSSLDGYGTEDFLKIVRYIIKDANIFVISHKTGLEDKFDRVLKFEKVKGFSKMV